MGKQEGISWERLGDGEALVVCRKVVPLKQVDALVRDLYSVCRGERAERPAPQQPLPPAQALMPSRSFGRLPPGASPYWQRREWNYFILWLTLVVGLLAGAVYRNASYFFWRS
jgi:hypothetical protein